MAASLKVRSEGVGTIEVRKVRFDYTDFPSAAEVEVLEIPGDAIPLDSFLSIDTAFGAGETIAVGNTADDDLYLSAVDATALAKTALDADWLNVGKPVGSKKVMVLKPSAAMTLGSGWLIVTYALANKNYTTQG